MAYAHLTGTMVYGSPLVHKQQFFGNNHRRIRKMRIFTIDLISEVASASISTISAMSRTDGGRSHAPAPSHSQRQWPFTLYNHSPLHRCPRCVPGNFSGEGISNATFLPAINKSRRAPPSYKEFNRTITA